MSLVRLLAIGNTLVSVKDKPTQYRKVRWSWPPKFCTPANPFAGGPNASSSTPKPQSEAGLALTSAHATATGSAPKLERTGNCVFKPNLPMRNLGAKLLKLFGLSKSTHNFRTYHISGAQLKQPVQCELSLEQVKVVRNDLSDSDIEVVPVRTTPAKSLAKVNAAAAARSLTNETGLDTSDELAQSCEFTRPVQQR